MEDKIIELIENEFTDNLGNTRFISYHDEHLLDAVHHLFEENEVEDYNIELVQAYQGIGYNSSVLCCSWIENGRLRWYNDLVEEM